MIIKSLKLHHILIIYSVALLFIIYSFGGFNASYFFVDYFSSGDSTTSSSSSFSSSNNNDKPSQHSSPKYQYARPNRYLSPAEKRDRDKLDCHDHQNSRNDFDNNARVDDDPIVPMKRVVDILNDQEELIRHNHDSRDHDDTRHKFCSNDPMHGCYSPACYLPIVSSAINNITFRHHPHPHHHAGSFFRASSVSSSAEAAMNVPDFHLSLESRGKGCQRNPFYRPSSINDDINNNNNDAAEADDRKRSHDDEMNKWSRGGPTKNLEYTCPFRKSERTQYFEKNAAKNAKHDPLFKFKKHTSWMFSKWYDWSGKCVNNNRQKSKTENDNEEFLLSSGHNPKNGIFYLKNVCLRPRGGFGGYFPEHLNDLKNSPRMGRFRGTQDTLHAVPTLVAPRTQAWLDSKTTRGFTAVNRTNPRQQISEEDIQKRKNEDNNNKNNIQFETRTRFHHFRLEKPASCYLDTKVLLISADTDNAGHAYYRGGSALRNIELAFGKRALNGSFHSVNGEQQQGDADDGKVTVGFIWTGLEHLEHVKLSKKNNMKLNKYHFFYELLGTSWFSIVGFNSENFLPPENEKDLFGFQPRAEDLDEHHVCFKEVAVASNAPLIGHNEYGMSVRRKTRVANENIIGGGTSFHIHGERSPRDVETNNIIQNKLRDCGQLPPRRKRTRRKENAHVIFGVRSKKRRITLQPYLISFIAQRLPVIFGKGVTFEVIEHTELSFHEVIERHSNADVLIALYGAALMWSTFMPPGSAVIEFNSFRQRYAPNSGISRNPKSEYGGGALVSGALHIVSSDDNILTRFPIAERGWDMFSWDFVGSFAQTELVLRSAACVIDDQILHHHKQHTEALHLNINNNNNNNNNLLLTGKHQHQSCLGGIEKCCQFAHSENDRLGFQDMFDDSKFVLQNAPMILNTRLFPKQGKFQFLHSSRLENLLRSSSSTSLASSTSISSGATTTALPIITTLSFFLQQTKNSRIHELGSFTEKNLHERCCRPARILFIEHCRARASLWAEVSALRQLFRVDGIAIAEFASGREECGYKQRKEQHNNDDRSSSNNSKSTTSTIEDANRLFLYDQLVRLKYCDFHKNLFDCEFPGLPFDYVMHDCSGDESLTNKDNCHVNTTAVKAVLNEDGTAFFGFSNQSREDAKRTPTKKKKTDDEREKRRRSFAAMETASLDKVLLSTMHPSYSASYVYIHLLAALGARFMTGTKLFSFSNVKTDNSNYYLLYSTHLELMRMEAVKTRVRSREGYNKMEELIFEQHRKIEFEKESREAVYEFGAHTKIVLKEVPDRSE